MLLYTCMYVCIGVQLSLVNSMHQLKAGTMVCFGLLLSPILHKRQQVGCKSIYITKQCICKVLANKHGFLVNTIFLSLQTTFGSIKIIPFYYQMPTYYSIVNISNLASITKIHTYNNIVYLQSLSKVLEYYITIIVANQTIFTP